MSEDFQGIHLRVLYDFEYISKDERKIKIQEGERLFLIKKTNSDWWQVIRSSSERPFFVPAAYVEEYTCDQDASEGLPHCTKNNLKEDKETDALNNSSEHPLRREHATSKTQTERRSDQEILMDKRKSWVVDELVTQLAKIKSESNIVASQDDCARAEERHEKKVEERYVTSSTKINLVNAPEDGVTCSSKHSITVDEDKEDSCVDKVSGRKNTSEDNVHSIVSTRPLEGLKNEFTITESVDEDPLGVQLEDMKTAGLPSKPLGDTPETSSIKAEDNKKLDSVVSGANSKLNYSRSFKTKKELQVLKLRHGNSVLSTSWENELSNPEHKKSRHTVQYKSAFRNSGNFFNSVGAQVELKHNLLKASHSGSELDALELRDVSTEKSIQTQLLLPHKPKNAALPSGSESEENLDESVGPDEGSVSGLSDDLFFQSGTSKESCSDISDSAISDDLFIASLGDERKKGFWNVQKRRQLTSKKNKVESERMARYSLPPSPSPDHQPVKILKEDWQEYQTSAGRTYYYNLKSHEKSWKPPRRQQKLESIDSLGSNTCPQEAVEQKGVEYVPVPEGWHEAYDEVSGQLCYINDASGAKWFSSNDSEGRVYFFEENSHESTWALPELTITVCDSPSTAKPPPIEPPTSKKKPEPNEKQLESVQLRAEHLAAELENKTQFRMAKAHSMVLVDSRGSQASSKSSSIPRNWPQLWDGDLCVLKEGTLNRTKITENGKKLRKNWAPAHVVLTELFLLFFKDAKTFASMKNSQGKSASSAAHPEFSVDLNGALLEHGEKASSRRNVFLVSTVLGLQVLLQCENAQQEEEWYQSIKKAIENLPSPYVSTPRSKAVKMTPQHLSCSSPEETKRSSRIGRSRSVKAVKPSTSQEDLTASPDENQTKIRNRLKKFFHRRPPKEVLVKKGIYKDEPVFGCHLPDVCKGESPRVPAFVQRCVAAIESKEENMKTDGLYRASGNLSQVQKIRLQVDQNNLDTLEQEEDVHVLTGALKLFFRELQKPLIPFEHFHKALRASMNPNKKEKLQQFRDIVKALPLPNRDTLEFLLRHLLRVTEHKESNRMHIPNLAIVFGPTLMWSEGESLNMALDLMQQNLVIECFLQEFSNIFKC
ncbi:rho GTPase-activating protein 12-like isoform X3 [Periplaneta americana]|uniref:rho GTPase-activating protein 12-like isoform X3 n=1 Tax=Periplaneta americana TaxID=6978 RepID=UPI0037E948DE